MKRIILLAILTLFTSCKSQQSFDSIFDKNLTSKIINQFNEKYQLDSKNTLYAFYIQENPEINSVTNNETTSSKKSGTVITVYSFKTKEQIFQFTREFNVYRGNELEYYIFDKASPATFLSNLKKNLVTTSSQISDGNYDPKSWVLSFYDNGKLEKCYPIECNFKK